MTLLKLRSKADAQGWQCLLRLLFPGPELQHAFLHGLLLSWGGGRVLAVHPVCQELAGLYG